MKSVKKSVLIILVALCSLLPACQDFLEQSDTRSISEDALFQKEEDGIALVNAIYDTFHSDSYMNNFLWYSSNFLSQDFKNYGADVFYQTYEVPPNFAPLNTSWVRSYQGIARANSAIPVIERMLEDGVIEEPLANRLTGEAYFLRGLFYYYLASLFGGVPLELETVTDEGRNPRNTQDEVFTQIVLDMETAASLLPWKENLDDDQLGRATKGAALAYKGSAQMWIGDYAEAVETFNQLEGRFQLEEDFIDIHEFDNQNISEESIFEVQFIEGVDQSWGRANDVVWLTSFHMPEEVSAFGYSYADPQLYNSFEEGDERKLATVIGPGDEHPSPAINIASYPRVIELYGAINTLGTEEDPWKGTDDLRSGYYSGKTWRDPNVTGATGSPQYIFGAQNAMLMRYGEVLLSKAEALFKSGNEAAAWDIINNDIRRRAGLDPLPSTENFIDALISEYRHELAGEFSLWPILRRTGEHIRYVREEYGITVPNGKDLLPIPQEVLDNNFRITQNPGY